VENLVYAIDASQRRRKAGQPHEEIAVEKKNDYADAHEEKRFSSLETTKS